MSRTGHKSTGNASDLYFDLWRQHASFMLCKNVQEQVLKLYVRAGRMARTCRMTTDGNLETRI